MIELDIDLNKSVTKTFRQLVVDALNFNVAKIVMKGGRSSFKSAVAVIIVILGCVMHERSCLCIVKTDKSTKDKIANNIKKFITILGLDNMFEYMATNQRFILLDANGNRTKHVIRIMGANKPDEIKSMTPDEPDGYAYTFIEEAALFKTESDLNSVFSTAMRGAGKHCFIMAYNPPMEIGHFLNKLYNSFPCGIDLGYSSAYAYTTEHVDLINTDYRILVHHSTYLDAVRDGHYDWIGAELIGEYELQRKNNEKAWKWDKLGVPVLTDANVFWNLAEYEYSEDIVRERCYNFIEFGADCSNGGSDPWRLVKVGYDKKNRDLYILGERNVVGRTDNTDVSYDIVTAKFKELNDIGQVVYGDGAVPNNITALRNRGLNIIAVKKDTKISGVMWLQGLNHIYIDKLLTPITYKEFNEYTYEIDKNGEITNKPKNGNDHSIDSTRYALNLIMKMN